MSGSREQHALSATAAAAQIPPPTVIAPVPPSSSLVLPAPGAVPDPRRHRAHRLDQEAQPAFATGISFCSHRGPCFPRYLLPIGQDLRLTIVSTDDNERKLGGDTAAEDRTLDSISQMYAALRGCWVAPPKDKAPHGMQYTIRFALKCDGEIIAQPRLTYSSHDAPAAGSRRFIAPAGLRPGAGGGWGLKRGSISLKAASPWAIFKTRRTCALVI